jgi:hypothetical protein
MNGLLAAGLVAKPTEVLRFFATIHRRQSEASPTWKWVRGTAVPASRRAVAEVQVATGWDISEASLSHPCCCRNPGDQREDRTWPRSSFSAPATHFSSITFSEVLEHLEQPLDALRTLYGLLGEGGRIYINAPVNSPAPDHIYLFSTPEQIVELVQQAGFKVIDTLFAPATGADLARARKRKLSISTAIIATK